MALRPLRLTVALLAAPLLSSFAVMGAFAFTEMLDPDFTTRNALHASSWSERTFLYAVYATLCALPVTLTLGLAVHINLRHRGSTGLLPYLGLGLLVGAAIAVVLLLSGNAGFALPAVAIGALTPALAWLIRRPDRDVANPVTAAP